MRAKTVLDADVVLTSSRLFVSPAYLALLKEKGSNKGDRAASNAAAAARAATAPSASADHTTLWLCPPENLPALLPGYKFLIESGERPL
eukprot:818451-Pyramimonas_sp.AAC.1